MSFVVRSPSPGEVDDTNDPNEDRRGRAVIGISLIVFPAKRAQRAQAGIHDHGSTGRTVSMGPRVRGDDQVSCEPE
jgi:hypothetical protein